MKKDFVKNKNDKSLDLGRTQKGFTLVEMMVSVFIFMIIMTAIVGVFARQINAQKKARIMEGDLENAQFALNYISKTLRTATIIGVDTGAGGVDLRDLLQSSGEDDFYLYPVNATNGFVVYDFSQEACIRFTFRENYNEYDSSALWMESQSSVGVNEIDSCILEAVWQHNDTYKDQRLTSGNVTGTFMVAPTRYKDHKNSRSTDTMGRATISMKVEPKTSADVDHVKPVYIQSSVALYDYPSDLSF